MVGKLSTIAMSLSKMMLGRRAWSVQAGARLTGSSILQLTGAILVVALMLWGGNARAAFTPYNVLVNPGAEFGDLTGWNLSPSGCQWVVSTNGLVPNTTDEYILAYSGKYVFELSAVPGDRSYIYQDFAAISNSQWTASFYAICYASNYLQSGASAHLQVVFYDASNNVVPCPFSSYGVFGTDFLDPVDNSGSGVTWTIVPPPAVDAGGWLFLQPTNLFMNDPATEAGYDSTGYPTNLVAPPGTAKVRFQVEFDNTGSGGGAVYFDDCVLEKLNQSDPDITNPPVAVTVFPGMPASFSVVAVHTGAYPGEKLSYQWQYNGTDLPRNGGVNGISGTTTSSTLTFTNVQVTDAGLYSVVVTVRSSSGNYTNSISSVPVPLTVLIPPCPKPSALCDPDFESAPNWSCWSAFNGCHLVSTNDVYDSSTTSVNVFGGNWCAKVGDDGDRVNGAYQVVGPVVPGTIWKAGGWAYISSLADFFGGNTCQIQVWFDDANGNRIPGTPIYESFKIYGLGYTNADAQYINIDTSSPDFGKVGYHLQLPRDQWIYLPVTNVVNNDGIGLGDDLPIATLPDGDFMVPTNTTPPVAQINYQVYEYCPIAADNPQPDLMGNASDAVYWDDMVLMQVLSVTNLTASISGNVVNLSFSARVGLDYAVFYKTNLTDSAWNLLTMTNIPIGWQTNSYFSQYGCPVTVSDPVTAQSRFYRVKAK